MTTLLYGTKVETNKVHSHSNHSRENLYGKGGKKEQSLEPKSSHHVPIMLIALLSTTRTKIISQVPSLYNPSYPYIAPMKNEHNSVISPPPAKNHIMSNHREYLPSTTLIILIVSIIIFVLLLAILVLIAMLRRLRVSQGPKSIINNRDCMFTSHSTINITPNSVQVDRSGCLYGSNVERKARGVQVFTLKEVETATKKFSEDNLMGNGVYRGVLRDGTVVAVEALQRHGSHWERAFRSQVDLLSRLRSQYISQLLGYCADENHRILIFEYMSNGTLQNQLHQNRKLNWGIRLKIALECAKALEYLHEHTVPAVIHRNLNSINILLDQNFRAKLFGFSLAKTGSDKLHALISTRVLGSTGYMAPEYVSAGKLSTKSDVYSYGVILLELLTGRLPIDTNRPPGERVLVSWALPHLTNRDKVMEMIDPTLQGQYVQKDIIQVAAIAAMCVQSEADYRPLMTDVVQSLIPLVKSLKKIELSAREGCEIKQKKLTLKSVQQIRTYQDALYLLMDWLYLFGSL